MADMWMPGAERLPQPGGVNLNGALPSRATWHITWDKITGGVQPAFDNVSGYLQRAGYCPHLMWDPFTGRIVQFYPASVGGRALNAWNEDGAAHIQIEVYFSPGVTHDGVTYNTVAETPCKGWAEILAWLDTQGIPRVWPMGSPRWQGNSRDPGIWNSNAGHYGHCNVPNNTHTDPGPMPSLTTTAGQSSGITPIQEDDMATVPQDQWDGAMAILKSLSDNVSTKKTEKEQAYSVKVFAQATANDNADRVIMDVRGQIAGLTEAIKQLATGDSVDLDAIMDAARRGAEKAIAEGVVRVDISIDKPEADIPAEVTK